MKLRRLVKTAAVFCMAAMITASFSGCQKKEENTYNGLKPDAVLLTVGNEKVTLKEAFFLIKWQQARYQSLLGSQYGEKWYSSDLFGNGESFQDYYKDYTIDVLKRVCLAKQHMKEYGVELTAEEKREIETVADTYMEENVKSARESMMGDKDVVIDVLTGYKILEKVTAKAVEDVDKNISDQEIRDEAYKKTYSYVYTSFQTTGEDGKTIEMSSAQKQDALLKLSRIRTDVLAGKDFDSAVSEQSLQVSNHSYKPGDKSDSLAEINDYMDSLQMGTVSEVVPLDTTGAFIGYLSSDNTDELDNEEVVNTAKENIMYARKFEMFKGIVDKWKADVEIKLDEDLWSKVNMEDELSSLSKS